MMESDLFMKKVCLIGSFRFYSDMLNIGRMLCSVGIDCWVPQPSKYRDSDEPSKFLPLSQSEPKEVVSRDALECTMRYFRKIDESDIVYVVDKGGYVGKSTLLDMGYACARNKVIYALEPIDDLAVMSLIKAVISSERLIQTAQQG